MNARLNDLNFHDPVSAYSRLEQQERVRELQRKMLHAAGESIQGNRLWFVLSVRNRCEGKVKNRLEVENIQAWIPVKNRDFKRCRHRGKRFKVGPIFPNYVFVRIVPNAHAFAGLRTIRDVESILGHGETPTPVPEENMCQLNRMVDDRLFDDKRAYASDRTFEKGDRVMISHGAFEFVQAVVVGYRGSRHVRCIANLFGGSVPVNIPLDKIELA